MALTEMQQKWVDALRSGKYKQCKEKLFNGEGYCCLGVGCVVAEENLTPRGYNLLGHPSVVQKLGLNPVSHEGKFIESDGCVRFLSCLNDEGKTFTEIADIIENEPEGLFVKEEA